MKRYCLIFLILVPMFLGGCATVSRRDRTILQAHQVPLDVYDKMIYGDPLSQSDVIVLSHRGVPPGLIVRYMNENDCVYRLSKADVNRLRKAGVSDQVLAYMLSTAPSPYGAQAFGGYPYPYPYYDDFGYGYPYYDDYWPYYGYGGWGWGRRGGWGRGGGGWGHGGGGWGGGRGGGGHGGGGSGHGR